MLKKDNKLREFFWGIDVHQDFFLICIIVPELRKNMFFKIYAKEKETIKTLIKNYPPVFIAIDAPSSINRGLVKGKDLRVCDLETGIGGYYWTPSSKARAKGWMRAGFELYHFFKKEFGYKVASQSKKGELIEVFPGIAFRRLCGKKGKLANKNTRKGKRQRAEILIKFFPWLELKQTAHNLDSALACLVAYFYHKKIFPLEWLGDEREGQILMPEWQGFEIEQKG